MPGSLESYMYAFFLCNYINLNSEAVPLLFIWYHQLIETKPTIWIRITLYKML